MGLAKEVLAGNVRATAKLMRGVEDGLPSAIEELKTLYPHTGRAHIVGITGSPGSGKSTLVDALVGAFRERDRTVGVVGVDPSSPFSGGAVLGDRVRMQRHAIDKGVFIRSLATRGWYGGLSRATTDIINIMDAMGKDIILVETAGVGQTEVDIMNFAHVCIVVLVPGAGDWVQIIKAGILEIADIFVINKADKGGASELSVELETILRPQPHRIEGWKPRILLTEAISSKGVDKLVEAIYQHREFLIASGGYDAYLKDKVKLELMEALKGSLMDRVSQVINQDNYLQRLVNDLVKRKTDPYTAASEIIKKVQ